MMATEGCKMTANQAKALLEVRMTIGLRESPYYMKHFYTNRTNGAVKTRWASGSSVARNKRIIDNR